MWWLYCLSYYYATDKNNTVSFACCANFVFSFSEPIPRECWSCNVTKTKGIWENAVSHLVSIRKGAGAICNCTLRLGVRLQISHPLRHNVSLDPAVIPDKCHLSPSYNLSTLCTNVTHSRQTTLWRNVWL